MWDTIMPETDHLLEEAGARLRDAARRSRWRYRRHLARRYDRDRFFRMIRPDVVGIEAARVATLRALLADDAAYTVRLVAALHRRLRRMAREARRAPGLPGPASAAETLRVVILGELAILRRQRRAPLGRTARRNREPG